MIIARKEHPLKTYIDLHIHSTASDGTFSPTEIVNNAVKIAGKGNPIVIALTDHDTTSGIEEFQTAALAHQPQLTAISGIEISTNYHGIEIHILGYNIDSRNKTLIDKLTIYRKSRDGRNEKIIKKLNEHGFKISAEELKPEKSGESIGRPHIARLLMKKNYVTSVQEAFDKYLAEGKCCYVERIMPTPQEAIDLIQDSGGLPVLAHIMLYKKLDAAHKEKLVYELKEAGLFGIEAYYNTYTPAEQEYVISLAKQWGLSLTGGTDFHGQNKPHISLFKGQGNMEIPENILKNLNTNLLG